MDAQAIPPGLTRLQWEGGTTDEDRGHVFFVPASAAGPASEPPDGLTWKDVEWLRSFAANYRNEWGDGEWGGETAMLETIAGRIAALLSKESP